MDGSLAGQVGLRERKKARTRQALTDAATTLFRERGFDAVTVAQITTLAEVSPRTFFLHFEAKEDVILSDSALRTDLGVRVLGDVEVGPGPVEAQARRALRGAVAAMIEHSCAADLANGAAGLRLRLAAASPTLRARIMAQYGETQRALTAASVARFPQLGELAAAVSVGAVVGAVHAAAAVALGSDQTAPQVRAAMCYALEQALPAPAVCAAVVVSDPAIPLRPKR